ncbi:BON domain-containing protein [Azotobacter beijerinckii]|uniref:Hyperosmotically inducible protein n=1 Tax=Azotobacter beijerinckii TaxID=170623 RepID=A0A1I3YHC5_9GAMM|nr:BON domain-containing protein [Azotobacter beijerinckii]SFB21359.1 hyperosmotically inducible protein [Azotobacter beijerinckii]SFK30759.1 hyperosmotically inducible protein [Azotobacter beijerinckii]
MKKHPQTCIAIALAAALGLSMANGVLADASRHDRAQPVLVAANETMDQLSSGVDKTGEVVSDSWITSKVKSTFLADTSLGGMDIKVETTQGVVSLSGTVGSKAEKELAIQKAKTIKGVTGVSADALKVAE